MRTDFDAPIALFLFAHQDDEFGVYSQIEREQRSGRRVCCVYATDGAATADPDRRNSESRAVLAQLGVTVDDIFFIGQKLGIGDCLLHTRVDVLAGWLNTFLDEYPIVEACFVPAWEGGHPDHDLLHAIAVQLLAMRDRLVIVRQYSLYHGRGCPGALFRTLSPLPENGPVERQAIGWRDRLRYIRLCLSYPSQWRSWIALFPFVCWCYLFDGSQQLQSVDRARIKSRPHTGCLYYERRAFLDWKTMCSALVQLDKICEAKL